MTRLVAYETWLLVRSEFLDCHAPKCVRKASSKKPFLHDVLTRAFMANLFEPQLQMQMVPYGQEHQSSAKALVLSFDPEGTCREIKTWVLTFANPQAAPWKDGGV